jgi:hypothetical protein
VLLGGTSAWSEQWGRRNPFHPVHQPDLQIDFWARLQQIRNKFLGEGLSQTVAALSIHEIDQQLFDLVGNERLAALAAQGLRGETFYAIPIILQTNPQLLGYYRLLYGLSQKEFYKGSFARFRSMEMDNVLTADNLARLRTLCESLAETAAVLVTGIQPASQKTIHELQLLTLGPQFRGSQNVAIGKGATKKVFDLIRGLVRDHIESSTDRVITLKNAAGRIVQISFASDPDITIIEMLPSEAMPNTSIEIKGGGDVSNVHNRIGEAEKSHLNARKSGFTRFWTILRARVDPEAAKRQSPTTTAFFNLDEIVKTRTAEHRRFKELLQQTIGIG